MKLDELLTRMDEKQNLLLYEAKTKTGERKKIVYMKNGHIQKHIIYNYIKDKEVLGIDFIGGNGITIVLKKLEIDQEKMME